jgi:ABC-type Na+ efflux pump permease subunit
MSSKTFLVAEREYLENLKTKTFWIGIISFPVILSLAILVPMWLEKNKDVRKYAVIDQSEKGWLLRAVEERADSPDLVKVLRLARDAAKDSKQDEKLPPEVRKASDQLKDISDQQIEMAQTFLSMSPSQQSSVIEQARALGMEVPEDQIAKLAEAREELRRWWKQLPPDEAKKLASGLTKSQYRRVTFDDLGSDAQAAQDALNKKLDKGEIFAYFVINQDPLATSEGCKYVSKNLTDDDLRRWFSDLATAEVQSRRIADAKIPREVAKKIQEPLKFEGKKLSAAGVEEKVETKDTIRQWAPVVFVYLLWISVFMTASMLLMNTIEEKSNRVIEVLLSSVSPMQLMAGKIAGIAATGLTVVLSWVVCFFVGIKFFLPLVGQLPQGLDLGVILKDPAFLASFVIYFFLGYLLFAALLVAIGSICNSLKEAQNLQQPVVIILIVPLLAMMPIGKDPNGTLAKVLSYIPLFTPFVMMNRAAGPPTTTEYIVTTVLLIAAIVVAMIGAAKIFRIGILMTGKPPKFKEVWQWLKAPVGAVPVRRE